ncbi:hypothetical protein dsat_1689 [Alkalidesulfovibrio alkalitolerans DSM 16529]|uniref:Uncharacterized protein n=1 Tax=Alkalidesulfovibrio alkalitolerans DSM 16529 TaxID=1121439 RepID=S7TH70_9BACT|nr:hypothetical protein [Alkalidesulfovibrio alkalitolerans]EPR36161.1 hypothetical protein dsat_1689 [Alkalidesulfovibrio alkalitolerans DSM 16529]
MSEEQPKISAEEREELKRGIYESLSPRRRKFIDRIGYENWDPFQEPKDPIDIRKDKNQMTTQQLIRAFLYTVPRERYTDTYARGAFEACSGMINEDERILGMFDFARWYVTTMEGNTNNED